jgi:hypothetical protein
MPVPSKRARQLAEQFARRLLRELPGYRTVAPNSSTVVTVTAWLLAYRQASWPRRRP